jgi:STE24 endopeptidase
MITALVSGIVLVVLAGLLVPWNWVPGGTLHPLPADQVFSPAQIARAEAFSTTSRWLSWSSYFLSLAVALVLGLTSWGARLVQRVGGRLRWWVSVPLGVLALLVVGRVVTLPFSIGLHRHAMSHGLSNQAWGPWLVDVGKSLLVAWVMTSLVALLVIGAARRSPRFWFAWAGGLAALVTVAGSFLYPVVVEPLFNNFSSMQPGPFKQSVFELAEREGVQVDDVLVSDASRRTTTLNAYVSGFGSTRRVVVYDTLLHDLSPREARVVIAHELAHAKNQDVLIGTLLGAVGAVGGVALLALVMDTRWVRRRAGVSGPGDPRAVALLLALVALGGFLVSPAQNTISRAIEARADRVSLQATGEAQAFRHMQKQLALHSLADPTPWTVSQFWFGSHPTVLQRMAMPEALKEAH